MFRALIVSPWRKASGATVGAIALALAALAALAFDQFHNLPGALRPNVLQALSAGMWAAAATAAGTLPVLLSRQFSQKHYDAALGLGGGIMLAATSFSLVLPAIAASKQAGVGAFAASLTTGTGVLIGMGLVLLLSHLVSRDGLIDKIDGRAGANAVNRAWLFVAAVAVHNLPEGLAIGVGYGGVDLAKAHVLATGIAIQDIPEGLVIALSLRSVGYSRGFSVLAGAASGLIEPLGAAVGASLMVTTTAVLPWGLSGAAGAMLYVICHDVVPEVHRHGNCKTASCAMVVGFIVMMVLDTALT
ncbi:MAG: ZIP family metal transporter [Pseudomonadota bacterium]